MKNNTRFMGGDLNTPRCSALAGRLTNLQMKLCFPNPGSAPRSGVTPRSAVTMATSPPSPSPPLNRVLCRQECGSLTRVPVTVKSFLTLPPQVRFTLHHIMDILRTLLSRATHNKEHKQQQRQGLREIREGSAAHWCY